MLLLFGHAAVRGRELERPEEVGALLEVRADGVNLVDQIFNANDTLVAEHLLDHGVVRERDALLVHLTVATLVDELSNALQVRVTEHDVRLNLAKLVESRLVRLQEDAVVDLAEAKELENLLRLRVDVVQTTEAHDKDELVLRFNVETTLGARFTLEAHEVGFLRGGEKTKVKRLGQSLVRWRSSRARDERKKSIETFHRYLFDRIASHRIARVNYGVPSPSQRTDGTLKRATGVTSASRARRF